MSEIFKNSELLFFSQEHINPNPTTIFVKEMSAFYLCCIYSYIQVHFRQDFSWKQTICTLIRLLHLSSLIWVHIVCNIGYLRTFISRRESRQQIVTGRLSVKSNLWFINCSSEQQTVTTKIRPLHQELNPGMLSSNKFNIKCHKLKRWVDLDPHSVQMNCAEYSKQRFQFKVSNTTIHNNCRLLSYLLMYFGGLYCK